MPQIKNGAEHRPRVNPKDRPDYTEAEIQAIRAWHRCVATPEQQKLSFDYVLTGISNMYDIMYRKDSSLMLLAIGQGLVGQHIVNMIYRAETKTDDDKISSRPEQR